MKNMTVKSQLAMISGSMGFAMLAASCFGLYGMNQTGEALRTVYEDRTVCIQQLAQVSNRLQDEVLALSSTTLDPLVTSYASTIERANKDRSELDAIWKEYASTSLTPTEKQLAQTFQGSYADIEAQGFAPLRAALAANQREVASTVLHQTVNPALPKVLAALSELRKLQVDVAKRSESRSPALRQASG
jgi:methyl-accepting chemotaxis protein